MLLNEGASPPGVVDGVDDMTRRMQQSPPQITVADMRSPEGCASAPQIVSHPALSRRQPNVRRDA
jgi:hypothetical protein